jgi:hypothetical protein
MQLGLHQTGIRADASLLLRMRAIVRVSFLGQEACELGTLQGFGRHPNTTELLTFF